MLWPPIVVADIVLVVAVAAAAVRGGIDAVVDVQLVVAVVVLVTPTMI